MSVSLLSLITLIDKYCMLFSDAAVAARLVQLTFQVIYKKKCTKRFCLVYNSNECSTYTITTYLLLLVVICSSDIRGLSSMKCSSKTLQNCYIFPPSFLFVFDFVKLNFFHYECPDLCRHM